MNFTGTAIRFSISDENRNRAKDGTLLSMDNLLLLGQNFNIRRGVSPHVQRPYQSRAARVEWGEGAIHHGQKLERRANENEADPMLD